MSTDGLPTPFDPTAWEAVPGFDLTDMTYHRCTLDGPRGPARDAQPGAAFLAGATGHPMLPFHVEADRFWTAGRWDATQIPKPFSTVAVAIGEPINVIDTTEATIEAKRLELERILSALESKAKQESRRSGETSS